MNNRYNADEKQYLTPDGKPPQDYEAGARRDMFYAEEPRYCGHNDQENNNGDY